MAINIKILFFGATADAVGERAIQIELAGGSSVADVLATVQMTYPKLESYKLLFAVNQEYLSPYHVLWDGDEVAFFTPVSGG